MNPHSLTFAKVSPADGGRFDRPPPLEKTQPLSNAALTHDLNNMITVILCRSKEVLDLLEPDSPARSAAEEVVKASVRAADMCRQLLRTSRSRAPELGLVDLNEIVSDVKRMVQKVRPDNIDWLTVLQPNLAPVKGDKNQLARLLLNLVYNACDAMPQGGQLSVTTATLNGDQMMPGQAPIPQGRWVSLTVSDTGCGIDEKVRSRLFEAFVTTKPGGNGLGLRIVQDVAQAHNGLIRYSSRLGAGTTFTVCFPEVAAKPGNEVSYSESLVAPPSAAVNKTLLVVEGDAGVRALAHSLLGRQGYKVLTVSNGGEALKLTGQLEEEIDLVLIDLIVPFLGGRELANKLREDRPELKIMFTSASLTSTQVTDDPLLKDAVFLPKPFLHEDLVRTVRRFFEG